MAHAHSHYYIQYSSTYALTEWYSEGGVPTDNITTDFDPQLKSLIMNKNG